MIQTLKYYNLLWLMRELLRKKQKDWKSQNYMYTLFNRTWNKSEQEQYEHLPMDMFWYVGIIYNYTKKFIK